MMIVRLAANRQVSVIVRAAFPDYRKRDARVGEFHPMNINSYWDGGSKDEFAFVEIETLRVSHPDSSSHPYFDVARRGLASSGSGPITTSHVGNATLHALPPGCVLVRAGTFCGKPATAVVYYTAASQLRLEANS